MKDCLQTFELSDSELARAREKTAFLGMNWRAGRGPQDPVKHMRECDSGGQRAGTDPLLPGK